MGIRFSCPACGRSLNVKAELAGKRGRCPHCQGKIVIPTEDAMAAESVTADTAAAASVREPSPGSSSDTAAGLRPEDLPTVVGRAPAGLVTRIIQPAAREASEPPTSKASTAARGPATGAGPAAQPATGEADVYPGPAMAGDRPAVGEARSQENVKTSGSPPAGPVTAAPGAVADAIGEAPHLQWYVMPPGAANQYGPAVGEEFRTWIAEGRVTADSLVWRQDWPDWKRADAVFSQLQNPAAMAAPAGVGPPGALPLPIAAVGAPMLGAGGAPVGQLAQPLGAPLGGMAPGGFPAIATAERFPIAAVPAEPSGRRPARPYRPRSNTGPMIVIVALIVAMIPLSYFVFKVISEQLTPGAATTTAAKVDEPEAATDEEPATSSNEGEE